METKKQLTAVEWLISQLNKQGFAQVVTDEEIKKAKEMEKEQIKDAWYYGALDTNPYSDFAEQYYNETFKSE
jgi:predicted GNAT family acetyltransferase